MNVTVKISGLLLALVLLVKAEAITLPPVAAQETPLILAFYYAWFDQNTWVSGQTVDVPAEPYNSAERTTIERHVIQAQTAGVNAFVQSWYGPQEANNQTETNFRTLLDIAGTRGFKAAVDVETDGPFFDNAESVASALTTLLETHAQQPAYLHYQDKPVIFFWRQERFSVDEWIAIRNQVDPNHDSYWIAEGVDQAYLAVFDGNHLYSIAWAVSPADQLGTWGNRVRAYAAENQVERLWVATAMPGYNDTRLPRENTFVVSRGNGDYYRETWQAALDSQPDMIVVTSFNEWLEGTQLEPSTAYGSLYLDITRELVTTLRGSPPSIPAVGPLTQEDSPEEAQAQEAPPEGPYIKINALTNVRSGPATSFTILGTLATGRTVPVIGQVETGDWWLISFENGPEGTGWVSAEVVEFVGESSEVPVAEAPAPEATEEPSTDTSSADEVPEDSVDQLPDKISSDVLIIQVPTGGVNVRSGPGLEFELLGRLEENTTVSVVAKTAAEDWWQVEYQSGQNDLAWVADVVVDFIGNREAVPIAPAIVANGEEPILVKASTAADPPNTAGSIEAMDPVNVRAEPSVESARVGGLFPGESADVLAVTEDGQWWQVEFLHGPDGTGWVATEFVRFQGNDAAVPIFGIGTRTPTPGPTNTPTATPVPPSATPIRQPATYAPTATSIYDATSAALLAKRGTPDPAVTARRTDQRTAFQWGSLPWGILSLLAVIGFFWYQFRQRHRRSRRL